MHIGLIRHFPVEEPLPRGWKTAADLHRWRLAYDVSQVKVGPADVGILLWAECVSSDMSRAVVSAQALFPGPVEQTPLLREPDFAPFATGALRLPVWAWRWVLLVAWAMGHRSQRACRDEFRSRVSVVADLLEAKAGDILVVSHAGMMTYLSRELRRRGFAGPKLRLPKHATLHLYEKKLCPRGWALHDEPVDGDDSCHSMKRRYYIPILGAVFVVFAVAMLFVVIPHNVFLSIWCEKACPGLVPASAWARNLDSSDPDLVRESLGFLAERKNPAGAERAVELLKDPDDYVWLNAAHYLGACGRAEAIPYLIKALRHTAWRSDAQRAKYLRALTGLDFGTDFARWQQWWLTNHPNTEFDWESHLGYKPRLGSSPKP